MSNSHSVTKALNLIRESPHSSEAEFNPPATEENIAFYQSNFDCDVPDELLELYRHADGGELYGLMLVPTTECSAVHPDKPWCSFHSWGDGNFDWLVGASDDQYQQGTVVFCDHETGKHAKVCDSLADWLAGITAEFEQQGEVWMPFDYISMKDQQRIGLYHQAAMKLKES